MRQFAGRPLNEALWIMNEGSRGWERFRLSPEEAMSLKADFGEPVLRATRLLESPEIARVRTEYNSISGIYFWLMTVASAEYKVYIGKTTSLSYRVANYIADFQPHSPNDFKLRAFVSFLNEFLPKATLSMFFARKDKADVTDAENGAIRQYRPLLNERAEPTAEAKARLRAAFIDFYQSSFKAKVGK